MPRKRKGDEEVIYGTMIGVNIHHQYTDEEEEKWRYIIGGSVEEVLAYYMEKATWHEHKRPCVEISVHIWGFQGAEEDKSVSAIYKQGKWHVRWQK